jgi:hypothetical protein
MRRRMVLPALAPFAVVVAALPAGAWDNSLYAHQPCDGPTEITVSNDTTSQFMADRVDTHAPLGDLRWSHVVKLPDGRLLGPIAPGESSSATIDADPGDTVSLTFSWVGYGPSETKTVTVTGASGCDEPEPEVEILGPVPTVEPERVFDAVPVQLDPVVETAEVKSVPLADDEPMTELPVTGATSAGVAGVLGAVMTGAGAAMTRWSKR